MIYCKPPFKASFSEWHSYPSAIKLKRFSGTNEVKFVKNEFKILSIFANTVNIPYIILNN